MKKQLLVFSTLVISCASVAQITINQADGPQLNQSVIQKEDTTNATGPGTNGPNITWNFASLAAHTSDTMYFGQVAGTPAAATFSGSGMCIANPVDTEWVYISNTSSALTIDGVYVPFISGPTAIKFNPPQKLITWPSTYNTSFTHTAKASVKAAFNNPPMDSIWLIQTIEQSSSINAWGTLTTPYGTFQCLRQDFMDIRTDSGYARMFGTWTFMQETIDTVKGARWWTNGKNFPVMEQDIDPATGSVNNTSYLFFTMVGLNETTSSDEFILCYPNPASDQINFITQQNESAEIIVTDMQGKVVHKILVDETTETINTSAWANGIYHYTLISKNSDAHVNGKIVVTH